MPALNPPPAVDDPAAPTGRVRVRLGAHALIRAGRRLYDTLQRARLVEPVESATLAMLYGYFTPLNARLADEFPLDLSLWHPRRP